MKHILWLLLSLPAWATTTIISVEPTAQQALVRVRTNQAGNCTYRASEGGSIGTLVHDVNTSIFASSNSDARAGSYVNGSYHVFVLGYRSAQRDDVSANKPWYSRSLRAGALHTVGVTCGSDSEVLQQFTTAIPPLGSTWADPGRYEPSHPSGYGWPTIDFTTAFKYIDPQTGLEITRVSGGQAQDDTGPTTPTANCAVAYAASGWTNPENACAAGDAVSSSTTPIFVGVNTFAVAGSSARTPSWSQFNAQAVDDVKVRITGNSASGISNNVGIALTLDGGATAYTPIKNATLGTTPATNLDYPSGTPAPYFSEWLGGTDMTPPNNPDMAVRTGTLDCSGTTVTWTGGHSFNPVRWRNGTRIVISGGTCTAGTYTISGFDSTTAQKLTLSSSAGTGTGSTWTVYAFGFLIYPQAGDTLTVQNVSWMNTQHPQFGSFAHGNGNYCHGSLVPSGAGSETGWLCAFPNFSGAISLHYLPQDADGRIGTARMYASQWLVPISNIPAGDGANQTPFGSEGGQFFNPNNPLKTYVLAQNSLVNEYVLVECTYNSAVGQFAAFVPPSNTQDQSPNLACVVLTKASVGGTLTDRMEAFDAQFDKTQFSYCALITMRTNFIGAYCREGLQDTRGWMVAISYTGTVLGMAPTYRNVPTRWAPVHAVSDAGAGDVIGWAAQSSSRAQTWVSPVTAINGGGGGLTTTASNAPCTGSDPSMSSYLARGSGCDNITLSGPEPCATSPTAHQLANYPACSWNASYRGLKLASTSSGSGMAWALGDIVYDQTTTDSPTAEFMLIVGTCGGNCRMVLRNYSPALGPFLTARIGNIQAHSAGFTAVAGSGPVGVDVEVYWNPITDPTGTAMVADYTYSPTAHGDNGPNTANTGVSVKLRNDFAGYNLGYSVRTGSYATQPGTAQNVSIGTLPSVMPGGMFGGVAGAGLRSGSADDHTSMRAPAKNAFFTGIKPGAFLCLSSGDPVSGEPRCAGTVSASTITQVSGTLYYITGYQLAASVNIKYRPLLFWAGLHAMLDVSSAATGDVLGTGSGDNWKFCYSYAANECRSGAPSGRLYFNVPNAILDGTCATPALEIFTPGYGSVAEQYGIYPCVFPIAPEIDAPSMFYTDRGAYQNGEYGRRLAVCPKAWFNESSFTNNRPIPDGSGLLMTCEWAGNVRSDVYHARIPREPAHDGQTRSDYLKLPVSTSGSSSVRIEFGYREWGEPASGEFYCTPRKENCSIGGSDSPFKFNHETPGTTNCTSACTINIPVIPGRVVYYRVVKGGTPGPVMIGAVN